MVQFSADPTTRGPLVEIEQSAKPLAVPHAAGPVGGWRARDKSIGETVMIPLAPPMIVVDELRDQVPQVPLAERNDAIETLLLDRPDESHGVTHGVTSGVRRAFRRQDHADASLARHAPASKGAPVFGAGSIAKATWGIPRSALCTPDGCQPLQTPEPDPTRDRQRLSLYVFDSDALASQLRSVTLSLSSGISPEGLTPSRSIPR